MFVDYVPLLLINMAGGLAILALYVARGIEADDQVSWVPAFAVVGLVAFVGGLHMAMTWPIKLIPKANLSWANVAYGETSALLGVLFLGAAAAIWRGWSLRPLSIYGAFAATAAIVIGVRIIGLKLSNAPWETGVGFIVTGVAGVLLVPALRYPGRSRPLRWAVAALLVAAAAIWGATGYMAYWGHLAAFSALPK